MPEPYDLPDEALVVRGGTLARSDLEKAAVKALHVLKRPGLSVFATGAQDPGELAAACSVPHPRLSFTRAGRLREVGFVLEQTNAWPHHTAWFPEREDLGFWLQMFTRAFDPPVHRDDLDGYIVGGN